MRTVRQLLSLLASMMLALPTGWCCLFTFTHPATAPVVASVADCCSSCCPTPAEPAEEAPTRTPMKVCCCENKVPRPDDVFVEVSPDDGLSTPVVADVLLSIDHFSARPANLCLSPPRPLIILQCRWLC